MPSASEQMRSRVGSMPHETRAARAALAMERTANLGPSSAANGPDSVAVPSPDRSGLVIDRSDASRSNDDDGVAAVLDGLSLLL